MNDSGNVMMEYAILCCAIGVILLAFMQTEKRDGAGNAISGFFNYENGYVGLGLEWAESVQLLHRAIASPVP